MNQEYIELVKNIKTNKVLLEKRSEASNLNLNNKETNINTVILLYKLSFLYNIPKLVQITLKCLERCFTIVAENKNFKELNFTFVRKIFSSSDLHITSELEVFNAVEGWICYNTEEREKFAKSLLVKVRLPLFSVPALNNLLNKESFLCETKEFRLMLQQAIQNKENTKNISSSTSYRYCNQNCFDIVSYDSKSKNLVIISGEDLKTFTTFATTPEHIKVEKVFCINGEIYILVLNYRKNSNIELMKYSSKSDVWETLADFKNRGMFSACSIAGKIYIFGGVKGNMNLLNSCIEFDTKNIKIKEVVPMIESRAWAACANYEGKVVVSGGINFARRRENGIGVLRYTNTVEVYDYIADRWTYMPNMVKSRMSHSLAAMKNKLFVIGENAETCEVFDKISNKFVMIRSPSELSDFIGYNRIGTVPMGNKVVVFRNVLSVLIYDTVKEEWYEEHCDNPDKLSFTHCAKIPQMKLK